MIGGPEIRTGVGLVRATLVNRTGLLSRWIASMSPAWSCRRCWRVTWEAIFGRIIGSRSFREGIPTRLFTNQVHRQVHRPMRPSRNRPMLQSRFSTSRRSHRGEVDSLVKVLRDRVVEVQVQADPFVEDLFI